jgi:hypothetical protein
MNRFLILIYLSIFILIANRASAISEKEINFVINQYSYDYFNQRIQSNQCVYLPDKNSYQINTPTAEWHIKTNILSEDKLKGTKKMEVVFLLNKGKQQQSNVSVEVSIDDWSRDNYLLLPGCAYNGNRFDWRKIAYSPKLLDPRDIGKEKGIIISDVPRLDIGNGPSRIQERSGSMATPSVGYYSNKMKESFYMLTDQENKWGDYGFTVVENRDRTNAKLSLHSPIVREYYRNSSLTTVDKPADFVEGDEVRFVFTVYQKQASSLACFFDNYMDVRSDVYSSPEFTPYFPFSNCFEIQQEKFNTENFVPKWGYYSVGSRENYFQDWQIGWTGGMISTYPLLFAGNEQSSENVLRNFDWLFNDGISPSGLFWCSGKDGNVWIGGDTRKPHTKNWHLIRKTGDGLYYIMKQFNLMKLRDINVKTKWENGAKQVADALVDLYKREKQFGQFVDNITGEIQVGGSTSGAIIPAALLLAADYYDEPSYLKVAEESAEDYYQKYVLKGVTCGGVGDALQNPDSESSYAMLESFILLYEHTSNPKWLRYATDMGNQYATWIFAYDYEFPSSSLFGKLNINSTGSVLANTQNKHSGPGVCTHSGVALLRLYRATGNIAYLNLLKETSFNMPQYMSRVDRPVGKMPQGWINERVNTTDWSGGEAIGSIFHGSCWAETSLMLTYVEVPGIYVDLDKERVVVLDNVDVETISINSKKAMIEVSNPTKYPAKVRVLVEDQDSKKKAFGENALFEIKEISLEPNQSKKVKLRANFNL